MRLSSTALVAISMSLSGGLAAAEDAPLEIRPTGGQNFAVAKDGELRVVGDANRYDIVLPTDFLFDFDGAALRPEAEPLLDQVIAKLAADRPEQVHVRGHTDSKGTDQYNYTLSMNRAKAVCERLERAVGGFNMCIGRGEAEPLVPNEKPDGADDPVNRQLNRRVTVSVVRYPDVNRMLNEARDRAGDAKRWLQPRAAVPETEPAR